MKCKLTGIEGHSVKAHIIPKSFYRIDPDERKPNKIVTNTKGQYPRRSPNGIYDSNIVTEEGERIFSPWDDYAAELLLNKRSDFTELFKDDKCVAYQIENYDYEKLKLFFLSVLWRTSVSEHVFFKKVNLGRHENIVRDTLLQGKAGDSDWYAVSLAAWSDHPGGMGIMDPFREKYFGINYYRIYLEGYIVYIKVDKRIAKEPLHSIQLTPDSPLIVVARELSNSKEMPVIRKVVKGAYK
jgi:hypothetical protein